MKYIANRLIASDDNIDMSPCYFPYLNEEKQGIKKGRRVYTSLYTGVCRNKANKRWQVSISINGEGKYIGSYENESDAAKAFDKTIILNRTSKLTLNFNIDKYKNEKWFPHNKKIDEKKIKYNKKLMHNLVSSAASNMNSKISKHSYKYHIKKGRHINHLPLHLVSCSSPNTSTNTSTNTSANTSNEKQKNNNTVSSLCDDHEMHTSSYSNSTHNNDINDSALINITSQSHNKSYLFKQKLLTTRITTAPNGDHDKLGRVEAANDRSDELEKNHIHFINKSHLKNDNHHDCSVSNPTDKSADTVISWFKQMNSTPEKSLVYSHSSTEKQYNNNTITITITNNKNNNNTNTNMLFPIQTYQITPIAYHKDN